ncbi:hypothetical protein A2165_02310 [Candidatus Curtissbacteria bacterium RBG_13_40_7]|uniref:UDP-N-acetylglucosamine--N-acetylmuramyl-(pentapeptide) pyrophosphoryl-undecaprenol N-acetylglucosamine transferase n=1 Tax=Candidatus Curtissbacteria bacterium RBG_13_40_7 TaxID=1797706 RepID=A0A1F5FYF8_9BACT|nr:MAG: hypothetical protein A2165_02310 [Candidatus Curtissbacteria bacterium RBG_13_40_7]
MKKIIICGGHLTPALALIDELEKLKNFQIIFFGRKFATEGAKNQSAEYRVITEKKIKFFVITAGRFQRKFTRFTLFSILKVPIGFIQSLIYLLMIRPKLIVSFGGYLSLPVVFCGWLLGIDSISHEQASVPGLATKINSLFVKKIFLSWRNTLDFFPKEKTKIIGNLVRKSIDSTKTKLKSLEPFLKKTNLILIAGGNQGSHFLNQLVFENLDLFKTFSIIHQTGTANYKGDLDKARKIKRVNYLSIDYLDPADFSAVLNKAKIVISRSGANTVWELALCKKPSILIPLPISASNEQLKNAQILRDAGVAKIINQRDVTPQRLKEVISEVLVNYSKYQKAADKFQKTLPRNSTAKLAEYILSYT